LKFIYDIDLDLEMLSVRKEGNRRILLYNGIPILKSTSRGVQMLKGLGVMLMKMGKRVIEIDGIFNGDTIFIPGIKGVSGDVIPGMEVVLVYGEEAVGRGISELSNLDLAAEKKGKGVSDTTYFH
jgi:predicted RNA-binding protein